MITRITAIIITTVGMLSAAPILNIKKIAGKSAEEVRVELGEPTKSENVKQGTKKLYKNGLVEVVFIKDKADWITITPTDKIKFAKESLAIIGLAVKDPTFKNQYVLKWEPYEDLRLISIFPGPNGIDYIYVMTKTP